MLAAIAVCAAGAAAPHVMLDDGAQQEHAGRSGYPNPDSVRAARSETAENETPRPRRRTAGRTAAAEPRAAVHHADSAAAEAGALRAETLHADTLPKAAEEDILTAETMSPDTAGRKPKGSMFDEIISGKNTDSLVYDVRNRLVYVYNEGSIDYQDMNLKADYMRINMETKEIYAYGKPDSVDGRPTVTHPVFSEGSSSYTMDTITYNISTKKAKIKGVATQEGDGWLIGRNVKKMEDNSFNIQGGMYTTCDQTDHPHFYLAMTQAKVIPGKKVVTGPAYLVMEDVPIYFLGIPEGFFPINSGPKSGLLMPTFGEDSKGFFLRDLGYYFVIGQHMDLALRGGIYTLGSWEASATSHYIKRYKYTGNFNIDFANVKYGEKGEPDYVKQNNLRVQWTHTQDPKANPGSTFSASVNFATSGYSRYSATNLNDILATQTNSSISYSKNWAGTPMSLSMNMAVSQNSQNQTIAVTLPNIVFNVSRIYPFKRKERIGKEQWYEKIAFSYSGKLTNSVTTTEKEMFTKETLVKMRNGIEHSLPISAAFNLFNYINISPTANYTERWYFKKVDRQWNPMTNSVDYLDPQYGFYRIYNYNAGISAQTTIYGMWQLKSKTSKVQAVRHTIKPQVGFSYAPDFSKQKYGYYQTVQSDSTGRYTVYSPFSDNAYGVPGSGQQMALNFSLEQTLEMKVLSKRDTSGVKKIKLIDNFTFSGSYNFLADSMKLSTIPVSLRTTVFGSNFGLQLSATLDPYEVTPQGVRYNKLMWRRGLPGRILSTGWSFGYTFKSRQDNSQAAINDINSIPPEYINPFYDPYGRMDPVLRRQYMAKTYYDFSIPWNIGFNYMISYSISYENNGTTGYRRNVMQTIGFNGSINITPKTGITFTGGYDIMNNKLTTSSISITRDLHCWQMSFVWIPFGFHKSWSFNIGVKASSLADLKYDKSQSMYDYMY